MVIEKKNKFALKCISGSVIGGLLIGGLASFLSAIVVLPYLYVLTGFYTVMLAGRVNGWIYIPFTALGSFYVKLESTHELGQAMIFGAEMIVIPITVLAAYHIFYWSNFFATYVVSPTAFVITCFWAVISSIIVFLINPDSSLVLAVPILWACLMPLWCFDLRVLHAPLFAGVYLFFYWLSSELIFPRVYPVDFAINYLPNWIAALSLVFVPELIGLLRPETRRPVESRPVTSDTMSDWEKLKGMKEILLLAISFFSMYVERFRVFRLLAPLGGYLLVLGIAIELLPLLGSFKPLPLWCSLLPVAIGIFLVLGQENYGIFALWTVKYSLALVCMRGLVLEGGRPGIYVLASVLFFLAVVLWFNRPAGNKKKGDWKELGQGAGRQRVEL